MVRALSTALGKHGQNAEVYLAALKKMCRSFAKSEIMGEGENGNRRKKVTEDGLNIKFEGNREVSLMLCGGTDPHS